MIANQSTRFCISLIHLSIAFFCLSFCVGFTLTDKGGSIQRLITSSHFLAILTCFFTGCFALIAFVFWQRDNNTMARQISYVVSFAILIQYLIVIVEEQKMKAALVLGLFLFAPIVFVFLLGVRKGNEDREYKISQNDILDSDFLETENISQNVDYFFKINRIVAVFLSVGGMMIIVNNCFNKMPNAFIPVAIILVVVGFLLIFLPKIGSWIASFVLSLSAIGIFCFMIYLLFFETKDAGANFTKIAFAVTTVSSVSFFFASIAMLLISREAKAEWKK